MKPLPPVVLSEEEQRECSTFIRSMTETDEGSWVFPTEIAQSAQRMFIGICLMGRAERFALLASAHPEYAKSACEAGAQACAIYPMSKVFFEFGNILDMVGRYAEAKEMYRESLRRCETEKIDTVTAIAMRQFDMQMAKAHATEATRSL